jgi:hypothetical protein
VLGIFQDIASQTICPGLISNHDPPDLSLQGMSHEYLANFTFYFTYLVNIYCVNNITECMINDIIKLYLLEALLKG